MLSYIAALQNNELTGHHFQTYLCNVLNGMWNLLENLLYLLNSDLRHLLLTATLHYLHCAQASATNSFSTQL